MMNCSPSVFRTVSRWLRWLAAGVLTLPCLALAQAEGGLYIAGNGFTLQQAATRALAQNPGGQRFFLLVLPPHTRALAMTAPESLVAVRSQVLAGNGVLLVCQRDIDNGAVDPTNLLPGVIAVRGWPPPGSNALPPGEKYYPDEDPANLPQATEALRRVRATCS
jgi:hypothetical protein